MGDAGADRDAQDAWRAARRADASAWLEIELDSANPEALRSELGTLVGSRVDGLHLGVRGDRYPTDSSIAHVELSLEPALLEQASRILPVLSRHALSPPIAAPCVEVLEHGRHRASRAACAHELPRILATRLAHEWAEWPLAASCAEGCSIRTLGPPRQEALRRLIAAQDTARLRSACDEIARAEVAPEWVARLARLEALIPASHGQKSRPMEPANINRLRLRGEGNEAAARLLLAALTGECDLETTAHRLARDEDSLRRARRMCDLLTQQCSASLARAERPALAALAAGGFEAVARWDWEPLSLLLADAAREMQALPERLPPLEWMLGVLVDPGAPESRDFDARPPDMAHRRDRAELSGRLHALLLAAEELPPLLLLLWIAHATGYRTAWGDKWDELQRMDEWRQERHRVEEWLPTLPAAAEHALALPW